MRVNWTTQQRNYLLPILRYEVQYRRVGHGPRNPWHWVPTINGSCGGSKQCTLCAVCNSIAPATHTYLEGLKINTAYWVRVRAVSAVGPGRWSGLQQYVATNGSEFAVSYRMNECIYSRSKQHNSATYACMELLNHKPMLQSIKRVP